MLTNRASKLFGLSLVLGTALCSGSAWAKEIKVEITGLTYNPKYLDVKAGDTVIWNNSDVVPHTVTSKTGKKKNFDSGQIDPGKSFKYVAKKKGDFEYICQFHPAMKGRLTVK